MQKVISGAFEHIRPLDKGKVAELIIRFLLSAATSSLRLFGAFSPFGVAFAASANAGGAGAVSIFGAALGYALSGDIMLTVKYLAILLLIRVTFAVLRNISFSESPWYPLCVTGVAFALVGFVYAFDSGFDAAAAALYVTECFVGAASVLFYRIALSPWSETSDGSYGRVSHLSSLIYLTATALAGLSVPLIFGVLSVGHTLAVMAVMLAIFKAGTGMGCTVAAAMGLTMDLTAGTNGIFTVSYTLSALLSGIFRKSGRLIFLLSFVCANALGVVWGFSVTGSAQPLFDVFAASVIFLLVPDYILSKLGAVFPLRASGYGFSRAREYTSRRIGLCSDAFSILAATASAVPPAVKRDDPAVIYDRATESVCRGCKNETRCWQIDYADTYDILNHLTPKITGEGRITAGDFPDRLTERCGRIHWLTSEINSEARAQRLRRRFRRDMNESREESAGRYGDIARVMNNLSRELSTGLKIEQNLERRVVKTLSTMSVDASAAVFRMRGGRLRVEIKSESLVRLRRTDGWLDELSRTCDCALREGESDDPTRLVLLSAEPLRITMGVAVQAKRGNHHSGDSFSGFETDDGSFCLVLADGMGTGDEAAKISSAVVSSLKRFIVAGVDPELSLRLLEHAMFLRNEADTETSTVDLLRLDAFTGDAVISKRGATASYLKRGGTVKKLGADSFPAGILSPKSGGTSSSFKVMPGDMLVMTTDGVTQGSGEDWISESVKTYDGGDAQSLAENILAAAKRKTEFDDDMSVIVIGVLERN